MSWSILRFQATKTLPPIARAHFHVYSWKADVFIHRLWNSVYDRWITSNFPYKWHTTAAQQVAAIPRRVRFSTEIPLERERRLEIQREQRRRRRQQEIAEQTEHRLAQRKQRRQQETEEQRNRRLEYPRHSGWKSLPLFFSQMNLRIHIKYSSTRLKQCEWRRKILQHY